MGLEQNQLLAAAIKADDAPGVKAALAAGANLDSTVNAARSTVLHFAAACASEAVVQLLLDRAEPDLVHARCYPSGETVLHVLAMARGQRRETCQLTPLLAGRPPFTRRHRAPLCAVWC